jgi:hypothetical protein
MQRVLDGDFFTWGLLFHAKMIGQINRCRTTDSGDFAFGLILVAWFLERVPMLHPRVFVPMTEAQEPQLILWASIFVRHGGGEGGHYFMATLAHVWRNIPQIIL